MIDLLLTHGTIITMDTGRAVIDNGAVAIDKGRIVDVGPADRIIRDHPAFRTMDCRHKVIMPGLIDVHGHAGHSLLKTVASDTIDLWMDTVTSAYFHSTTDEFWYIDGLLSALERVRSGVTCGMSVIGSMPRSDDPVFGSNHARAYAEVGIREVVGVGPCAPPWPHPVSRWTNGKKTERMVSFEETLAGAEAVIQAWDHGANDTIRVFITPFTIVPSLPSWGRTPPDIAASLQPHDRELSRRIREIASKYSTRIHSDAFGGMIQLAFQDENRLLGPDVLLQHCTGLSLQEIRILAETDTRVGHSPKPMVQRCPASELLDAGVTVAISTDGNAPRSSFDLLQAARKIQFLEHLHFDDPFYLPPGKLLEMVTIDAAHALGWEHDIGSLEPGKQADIAIVNMRQPHLVPDFMVVHRLMYEASGSDIETVIVNGKIVMEDRHILTVNENDVLDAAQEESLATVRRAGLEKHLTPPSWGQVRQRFDCAGPCRR
jgi:cytosine/adenosine deaminase-related metal-dependent hydrolase